MAENKTSPISNKSMSQSSSLYVVLLLAGLSILLVGTMLSSSMSPWWTPRIRKGRSPFAGPMPLALILVLAAFHGQKMKSFLGSESLKTAVQPWLFLTLIVGLFCTKNYQWAIRFGGGCKFPNNFYYLGK